MPHKFCIVMRRQLQSVRTLWNVSWRWLSKSVCARRPCGFCFSDTVSCAIYQLAWKMIICSWSQCSLQIKPIHRPYNERNGLILPRHQLCYAWLFSFKWEVTLTYGIAVSACLTKNIKFEQNLNFIVRGFGMVWVKCLPMHC